MIKSGPDFYDNESVFQIYSAHRAGADSPNENMEQPCLWSLIGDPKGLSVLDLGCGEALVAKKFKQLGARSYLGIEGSGRMFESAQKRAEPGFSEVQRARLEDAKLPEQSFDLVISSLVFHYIEDLQALLAKIHKALKPGGRLIFSVEHPNITSCNKSLENTAVREAWIVDDYFHRGARTVEWMGDVVTKYHRTLEDHLNLLRSTGFHLNSLKEAEPLPAQFSSVQLLRRRQRIPLFLLLSARKAT